ncbi:MAG: DUF4395 domain-containing protein [Campylobacterales bacterium]|nr:DUF4395 domain-containing protein [Campylobacterales bacterium]
MFRNTQFGEEVAGYDAPVLNARELRAGTGILFAFGMFAFMKAFFTQDFIFAKLFVMLFTVDFAIRLFIHPKYAPILIIGRFFVQEQSPEYVGASQKRFAWSLAFAFALTMFLLIVVLDVTASIKMFLGITLLTLFFCESIFSICLGCKLYPLFSKKPTQCEGGSCELKTKEAIQQISTLQYLVAGVFMIAFSLMVYISL